MTIKEMEALSGMTRANIRFYETEGLLSPARNPNGYRDYSEEDLEILKKIRLLRALHISLEEIKALHTGEQELSAALDQHLAQLEAEQAGLEQAQQVCRVMRSDGVSYHTLDAQHYLDVIDTLEKPIPELAADTVPKVQAPVRRYFARSLDMLIYSTLWGAFLALVFHVNLSSRSGGADFLDTLMGFLLMFLLEPIFLSRFGTTPGKWILGLSVTDNDDRRLTYTAALERTWMVFFRGEGMYIPIYSLYRNWKSFSACADGETLEWEYNSTLVLRDEKKWRIAAFIGAYAAAIGILVLSVGIAEMPCHHGDITVAEFSENFNQYADYYGIDFQHRLDEHGKWQPVQQSGNTIIFNVGGDSPRPEFIFEEENGVMTGMRFSVEIEDPELWPSSYEHEMAMSALAFVKAQKGARLFSNQLQEVLTRISEHPYEDFHLAAHGVSLTCDIEHYGYHVFSGNDLLIPREDTDRHTYSITFVMQKQS